MSVYCDTRVIMLYARVSSLSLSPPPSVPLCSSCVFRPVCPSPRGKTVVYYWYDIRTNNDQHFLCRENERGSTRERERERYSTPSVCLSLSRRSSTTLPLSLVCCCQAFGILSRRHCKGLAALRRLKGSDYVKRMPEGFEPSFTFEYIKPF